MSIEKTPDMHPVLVPRNPKDGDPRRVEVWHTQSDPATATGDIEVRGQERVATEIDPETGKTEPLYDTKNLQFDYYSEQGQEDLARELADQPLRGDTVYAIGEDGSYIAATMEKYGTDRDGERYGVMVDRDGVRTTVSMDELRQDSQAVLAEEYARQQGSGTLSGVEEPNPWSSEAAEARRAAAAARKIVDGSPEDALSGLELKPRDRIELTSYAAALAAGQTHISEQNLARMSDSAREVADSYAEAVNAERSKAA